MFRLLIILAAVVVVVEFNDAKPLDQAAVALAVAACFAYLWSRLSVRRMTLVREPLVDHVSVGETFSEQLTLLNGSLLPKPWLEVIDFSTLPGHAAGQVVRAKGKGAVRWTARSVCRARGEFDLGPVRVRSGDPFGLFGRSVVAPETIRVLVWPVSFFFNIFKNQAVCSPADRSGDGVHSPRRAFPESASTRRVIPLIASRGGLLHAPTN